VFVRLGAGVDTLLPSGPDQFILFWVVVAILSIIGALSFAFAAFRGGQARSAAGGLTALVLLEAALFAGPFNPRESPADVPPPNNAMAWLRAHTGPQYVAALGFAMDPESATLYGLRDVRGYEAGLLDARHFAYWSSADPALAIPAPMHDPLLETPRASWLAAAGVSYVVSPGLSPVPGAHVAYRTDGVTIWGISRVRPLAYAATTTVPVVNIQQALAALARDPLGPTVVEGSCCRSTDDAHAHVIVRSFQPGAVDLDVSVRRRTTVVVLQSFWPGWVAQVDGKTTSIAAANVIFQAVRVPAGHHLVTLRYQPRSVSM
jgi:hypothetical protein